MLNFPDGFKGIHFKDGMFTASAIINTSLKSHPKKFDYPLALFVEIAYKRYRDDGLPTQEEAEHLDKLEDEMVSYFEKNINSIFIGHTSMIGRREIIFYLHNRDEAENYLTGWIKTTNRKTMYSIYEDASWRRVNDFLRHLF